MTDSDCPRCGSNSWHVVGMAEGGDGKLRCLQCDARAWASAGRASLAASLADQRLAEAPAAPSNPYVRTWRGVDIDVYRICALWGATHPGQIQALKKILCAGQRGGGKSVERDVEEAIVALQRWMEMRKEEE